MADTTTPKGKPLMKHLVSLQSSLAAKRSEIEERGATAVEYGLMVGLIAVAIIGAVGFLSKSVQKSFNTTGNAINNAS
jgi:pilus assembly protein Flp/PilA